MFFSFIYHILLWILVFASLPKILYQFIVKRKYRSSLGARFGKNFPHIEKKGKKLIWIHAVSVGETKAIAALAKLIKTKNPDVILVVSTITETGHAEGKRSLPFADHHVYLPLDFGWVIGPIIKRCSPDLVLLCETDFWYNFLRFSKECGATIVLANGKLSDRTCERLKRFPRFSQQMFSLIDLFCVQAKVYQKRFEEIGVPEKKILITGNLKFDEEYPKLNAEDLALWKERLGIAEQDQLVVIGSSHDPEEKILLEVMNTVWQSHPKLKVMIVPRHPERFKEVAGILEGRQIPFVRFSSQAAKTGKEKVILVDAMGLLRQCYQVADVAIVAGSYTPKVGGHNILEPSWYGVPVIYGPYMHTQPELVVLTKEYQTGVQVPSSELAGTIQELLSSTDAREKYRMAAGELLRNCSGAKERTWAAIKNIQKNSLLCCDK